MYEMYFNNRLPTVNSNYSTAHTEPSNKEFFLLKYYHNQVRDTIRKVTKTTSLLEREQKFPNLGAQGKKVSKLQSLELADYLWKT